MSDSLYSPLLPSVTENTTLSALATPLLGYQSSSPSLYIAEGATLTLASGANIYLQSGAAVGLASIGGEGSLVLEGDNDIRFYDDGSNDEAFEKGISFNCGKVILNGGTIHGTVEISSGQDIAANGTTFNGMTALMVNLEDWDGTTTPGCLDGLVNCQSAEGSRLAWRLQGLGGTTLTWDADRITALLAHDAFSRTEVEQITLKSGDKLLLTAGTSLKGLSITVGEGAVLECGKGCRLEGEITEDYWGEAHAEPPLVVKDGGTLVAEELTIAGNLVVSPGSLIEGTLHFEKGSRICLVNWSGSTLQLVDKVLAKATWTSDEPLVVEIIGHSTDNDLNIVADSQLVNLGSRFGAYRVPESGGYFAIDARLTVAKGVDIEVEDSLGGCNIIFEGDNVVRAAEGYQAHVNAYTSIVAHGTRFDIPVMFVEQLSGENITFAGKVPFGVNVGGYPLGESGDTGWDGTAAALEQAVEEALKGINGYSIEAENPILGIEVMALTCDLHLSPDSLQNILPSGFSGLHFSYLEYSNQSVTVAAGATLDADNISLGAHARLTLEEGAKLTDSVEGDMDINVMGDATSCGTLDMTGVDLNGVQIYGHGNITLRNCKGKGELNLSCSYQTGKVSVTNCDLSQVSVTLLQAIAGETSSNTVFDFSGNYWGTTDLEEIKARIQGYDAARITLGNVLASSPCGPDTTAPTLTLNTPSMQKQAQGKTSVTFSWKTDETATCELTVDGKSVYTGRENSFTLELADGRHSYKVTATDAAGNTSTRAGESFTLDATAPTLTLREPKVEATATGQIRVTLSWKTNETVTCQLTVDDKEYTVAGSSHTLTLEGGTHRYQVTATDAAGNTSTASGNFSYIANAPELTLLTPVLKAGKGRTSVTLRWLGEKGCRYDVYVDGKRVMSSKKTQWKGTLRDGEHSYTVVAIDEDGLSNTQSGELQCDATAPTLVVHDPRLEKTGNGSSQVTLSWASNENATYTVTLGKAEVYRGTATSCTLQLADGKYSYTISAVDAAGNSSKAKKGSFTTDTTAPALTLKDPKLRKSGNGLVQATLSWKGEARATCTLTVDGREYNVGKKSSYKLTLADGVHRYSVTATDAAGNTTTRTGSFTADTTAPLLSLGALNITKAGEGRIDVSFNWMSEAGASYLLKVDGRKYKLSDTSFTLFNLKDGKHLYELTASDAAGNNVTLKDTFTYDATAPRLSMKKPRLTKAGEGKVNVLFSWSGEKDARYTLSVGGKSYDVGMATSYELILADGTQDYSITATDAAGNATTKNSSFSYDATSPILSQATLGYLSMKGEQVQATLSWRGEENATYTVMVDGKKVYSGKKSLCTLKLSSGMHSYSIIARDKARNESLALTGSIDTASLIASATAAPAAGHLDRELELSTGVSAAPLTAGIPLPCGSASTLWETTATQLTSLGTLA